MPELPEVETTLRGIAPYVDGQSIKECIVREHRMRWPVPVDRLKALEGQRITSIERRAKYILLHTTNEVVLLHLGMSGSIRGLTGSTQVAISKHDHIDICFENGNTLRFNDPRRFGCCLVIDKPHENHSLLAKLGPEPLSDDFNVDYLWKKTQSRKAPIKNVIMDGAVVVGVGNIYASESLYEAGIRPATQANRVSKKRLIILVDKIKAVLHKAIQAGGTTLNDFTQADGKPGYFRHELQVYARAGLKCYGCGSEIKSKTIGQRNTFYCTSCQR